MHPDHDRGLEFDVRTLVARRSALGLLGGAGLAALAGCTDGSPGAGCRLLRRDDRLDHLTGEPERDRDGHGIRHARRRHPGARRDGGPVPR